MPRATPAASRHTAHRPGCPLSAPDVLARFDACLHESRGLARDVLAFLQARPEPARAKWAQESVAMGRVLFQPWAMEILFVLAITRESRFGELQRLLGRISSRTLSDKLQKLREEGLVAREVHDEQPVRIEYRLTKEGRVTAALATPLFAHLNHRETPAATAPA